MLTKAGFGYSPRSQSGTPTTTAPISKPRSATQPEGAVKGAAGRGPAGSRCRRSGGPGRRAVAAQDALAICAGRGHRAVRVQADRPAPAVHGNEMVKSAEQEQILEAGGAALASGPDVMHLTGRGPLSAAGEPAAAVPGGHRAAQVRRDLL